MKRFLGWEPETFYGYDDAGVMVASRPEPEWDEAEQCWMLALDEYRRGLCPACGGPADECTDPASEGKYESGPPTRCHRQTAISVAQADIDKYQHPSALMWGARRKP